MGYRVPEATSFSSVPDWRSVCLGPIGLLVRLRPQLSKCSWPTMATMRLFVLFLS